MPPSAVTGAVCYSHSIAAAAESYTAGRAKFPAVFCRSDAVRVRLSVDGQHQHGAVVRAARPLNGLTENLLRQRPGRGAVPSGQQVLEPLVVLAGYTVGPEIVAAYKAKYGLDQPLPVQFVKYVGNMLKGDLGVSYNISKNTPISQLIKT